MTDTVLKNNKIKAMVFDMDGTLLDTEHQYIEGYLKLAQERGLNMDKKFPYTCMGLPREMVRKRYRDTFGADFDFEGFRAEMINRVHTLWQNEGIAIKPGVVEFLDYCDNNGILCAVATSTTRDSAEMMLKTTNLFDRFGAVVCGDVTVGEGTAFWFNSVCRAELQPIKIGKRCNIQDCAVIHNLCTLGDDVSVGHGAIVHGATVGDRVIVGMGAIVLDGAKIGDDCIIAAGAVVTGKMDAPAGSLLVGSPAVVAKPLNDKQKASCLENSELYYRKSVEYRAFLAQQGK